MASILVVDDEAPMRRIIEMMLTRSGHTVVTAENGVRALQLASQKAFDLLITDLLMPEKEGIETIIVMRKKYPTVKIIAISGGGDRDGSDYLEIARKLGAAETIPKPFTQEQLLDAVALALGD